MRSALLTLWLAVPASAADVDFIQVDWGDGAVPGSTTSLTGGWKAYDSQDGNVIALSTGLQSRTGIGAVWLPSDDGTGDTGFAKAGSLFSSTTLSGTGTGASVALALGESVEVRGAALPQGRELMSAAYHPGTRRVYLFGGRRAGDIITNEVLEYDPVADTLQLAADLLPTARAGTSAAYDPVSGRIFVFGGFDSGGNELAQIVSYDPVGHSVQAAAGSLPTARSLTSAAYDPVTARIYVFGGRQFGAGTHLDQIASFDPATEGVVAVSTTLPSGRVETAAAYDPASGDVLVFGGNATGTWLAEVVAFHPGGSSTTLLSPLPAPRAGLAAARHPLTGKIYLYGGENAGIPSEVVLEFDPYARTVSTRPPVLPAARARAAAAADEAERRLFVFGGTTTAGGFAEILENVQVASGAYRSAVFDTGNLSLLGNVTWSPAVQADTSTALGLSFRAGNTPVPGPTWSNGGAFQAFANGGNLIALGANRYVQFAATFTTVNISTTPILAELSLAYSQTAPSGTLTSSAFDSGRDGNVIRRLRWSGSFQPGTTSQFQLRSAPDDGSGQPGTWSPWLGPTSSTDAYRDPDGGETIHSSHTDGSGDRFFQYRAVLLTSGTVVPAFIGTVTVTVNSLPAPPVLDSVVAVSTSEILVTFTDASDDETEFVVSSGTLPGATNFGASTPTASSAGTGGSQSVLLGGLLPNVAYFIRVRARNGPDGLLSAFSSEGSSFTFANAPAAPAASDVFLTSAALSWDTAGNSGSTVYELSLSTDAFSTHVATPIPFAAGLTAATTSLIDLEPGTTYSFRLRALNGNNVPSPFSTALATETAPAPLAGLTGAAVGTSSITWSWDSSGPAARYRVLAAVTGSLLGDVGSTSFTAVGLSSNSALGIGVIPYTGTATGELSARSTFFTLAAVPEPLAAVSLGTGAISLSWPSNGNPVTTRYEVALSTAGFPLSVSTPIPLSASFTGSATTFVGLDAGTTHHWRVRAFNGDGVPSSFAAASTQTFPGALTGPAGTALGVSSLSWTWTNTAGPAVTGFELSRASDGAVVAITSAAAFVETALSSDTAYGLRVRALGGAGAGSLTAAATVFTHAAAPEASAVAAVFVDSVSVSWSAAGNPPATVYQVETATPGGVFALASTGAGTVQAVVNLLADTTHSFRVRAVNGDGVPSAYDSVVSSFVAGRLPLPVGAFKAFPAGSARILLSWTVSPTTTAARYDLFFDSGTGAVDYGVVLASVAASATDYLTAPLTAGVTYTFGVRTVDERGASEKNTDVLAGALALSTQPALSAFVRSPPGGARVWGDRLTLTAGLAAGVSSAAARVSFQFRASSSAAWTETAAAEAAHPNPDLDAPFAAFWDVTGLSPGAYQVRAVARDGAGSDDPAPPVTTLQVGPASPDYSATRLGPGRVETRLRVYRSASARLEAADPLKAFTTDIVLSTGCLAADEDVLVLDGAPAAVPVVPSSFAAAGIYRGISLQSGQSALSAGRCAALSFARLDEDGDRRVDGTETRSDNLVIAYYDAALGLWRTDFPSRASAGDGGSLSGETDHFTLFAALSPAAADLSTVRVYPVPWRPNNGVDDDGKPWSAGDPTSGIIFDNLPADARLSVYTVAGSLVWEAQGPAQGGLRRWDVRTGDGRDVASGVYFLVVTAPDGAARVAKLAVIR